MKLFKNEDKIFLNNYIATYVWFWLFLGLMIFAERERINHEIWTMFLIFAITLAAANTSLITYANGIKQVFLCLSIGIICIGELFFVYFALYSRSYLWLVILAGFIAYAVLISLLYKEFKPRSEKYKTKALQDVINNDKTFLLLGKFSVPAMIIVLFYGGYGDGRLVIAFCIAFAISSYFFINYLLYYYGFKNKKISFNKKSTYVISLLALAIGLVLTMTLDNNFENFFVIFTSQFTVTAGALIFYQRRYYAAYLNERKKRDE
ncbi:MAG: hypothetical protein LBQ40_00715 [Clostridiales bacterium]|jgi:hypothetical protein|nr:hypothetical protein [Clostridiales bacterium]